MNRLIRAEWYRFSHSNHFMIWLAVVSLIFVLMMSTAVTDVSSVNLGDVISGFGDVCTFMMMLVATYSAAVVGIGYMRKTAYYEVMAGNRISHILFSKMIAIAIPVAICSFIGTIIIPMMVYMQNGLGEATQVVERFLLFFVIVLHICICSVWMVTAMRHIAATVAVYLRFAVLELILMLILNFIAEGMVSVPEWMKGLSHYMVQIQMYDIFKEELTIELVVAVFISLLLESTFWYIVSYFGMKKKLYG